MTCRVSAILAVRDGMPYLPEALDSILGQTRPPAEIIVVDDGSTDATRAALAGYGDRIIVIPSEPRGQAAAVLRGIAASTGSVLAFQDADDLWPAGRLQHQIDLLAAEPQVEAAFGLAEQFVSPELDAEAKARLTPQHWILPGELAACMVVRRDAYERVGPFDPTFPATFFYDWLARAKTAGLGIRMLDEVVLRRRLHPRNYGRVHAAARDRELLALLRRRVLRGRVSDAVQKEPEQPRIER